MSDSEDDKPLKRASMSGMSHESVLDNFFTRLEANIFHSGGLRNKIQHHLVLLQSTACYSGLVYTVGRGSLSLYYYGPWSHPNVIRD